ncbi:MAG: DNA-directed RNA polymerase subunit beta, partial [Candidatus Paceibacterota bacterium]
MAQTTQIKDVKNEVHTKEVSGITKKYFKAYKDPLVPIPNLIEAQRHSFEWLIEEGLKEIFQEFSPVRDFSEKKFDLEFYGFEIGEPQHSELHAKDQKLTYDAPLKVKVKLINKTTGSEEEQEIFLADFPLMTSRGTFVIGGIERVIVPQLARSYGAFFTSQVLKGKTYFGAKIIPTRGAWIEFETDADNALHVRIDRKRKFPVTTLLRVLGAETNKDMEKLFKSDVAKEYIKQTLAKDAAETVDEAAIEIYKRLRDGDLATAENAKEFITTLFSEERYDLSRVGRSTFNKRFGIELDKKELERRTLSLEDFALVLNHVVELNTTPGSMEDDIDHLGSRRVRYIGELFQQKLRVGMSQIKRNIQNRMSTIESDVSTPVQFISAKPLQARIKEFFTTNQLSQYMQQENPLAEVEHLRTLSALGPGGLNRARAGFEVRDVHSSHYGRVCPIHTPEGGNIGLILRLSVFAQVNEFGMIETPYAKVEKGKM